MKTKPIYAVAAIIGLFFILSSWNNYRVDPLALLSKEVSMAPDHKGITITSSKYTVDDSKLFLGRDVISRGYQPVQITIKNNTSKTYVISQDEVSLPLASAKKVAFSITKDAIPRAIGLKIASFLFWPFMIPSTIDSIRTYKSHTVLKKDYTAKSVKKGESILPYSTMSRILFVPVKKFQKNFTIGLIDLDTSSKAIYEIHLKEKA